MDNAVAQPSRLLEDSKLFTSFAERLCFVPTEWFDLETCAISIRPLAIVRIIRLLSQLCISILLFSQAASRHQCY
jgi:hypothetical protein